MKITHLVCHLLAARRRAVKAATAEALAVLCDCGATAPSGGAMSDLRGVYWIDIPVSAVEEALNRFPRLGYTRAIDLLEPVETTPPRSRRDRELIRWRKQNFRAERIFEINPGAIRRLAPDRRTFTLETANGKKRVTGYRGDGSRLGRRALPVCDARLVANLATAAGCEVFLDTFAGAGGIIIEAAKSAREVISIDVDPALAAGLSELGARHIVASATDIPLAEGTVDTIGTEPPYDEGYSSMLCDAIGEMTRVLKPGGRLAMLCAERQTDAVRSIIGSLTSELDLPIDRKGTACRIFLLRKPLSAATGRNNSAQ